MLLATIHQYQLTPEIDIETTFQGKNNNVRGTTYIDRNLVEDRISVIQDNGIEKMELQTDEPPQKSHEKKGQYLTHYQQLASEIIIRNTVL